MMLAIIWNGIKEGKNIFFLAENMWDKERELILADQKEYSTNMSQILNVANLIHDT